MNVKLLRKVAKYILEEPRRLAMGSWVRDANPKYKAHPACGTQACIAGTACILSGKAKLKTHKEGFKYFSLPQSAPHIGQKELGLTHKEACRLFLLDSDWGDSGFEGFEGHWPHKFIQQYEGAKTNRKKARIAVARIEHFIKTCGKE
jgi:hypothetical protein